MCNSRKRPMKIVLNSLNLEISSAEVIAGGKTQQAKVSYDQPNEIIRLTVAEAIPPGPAALHLQVFRQAYWRVARPVPEQDLAAVLCRHAVRRHLRAHDVSGF